MEKKKPAFQPDPNAKFYNDIIICCLPLLAVSCYFYGRRPLLIALAAIITANLIDRLGGFFGSGEYNPGEHSSECFALLLTLLMPATISYRVVITAVIAADLIGKQIFGGAGSYPFHPAAVGYAVAAVSWPEQVFRYPQPFAEIPLWDASAVATVASSGATLKNGGLPNIDTMNLVLGNYAGPMATAFTLVVLGCALYLLVRQDIDVITPACFVATMVVFIWLFPRLADLPLSFPWQYLSGRLNVLKYELFTGGLTFAAVFLVSEPVTVPRLRVSRAAYGVLLGIITVLLRYYGSYEMEVCFALLLANAVSGWLDRAVQRVYGKREVKRLEG